MCKRFYLAYGSNLNIPQMQRRCPTAKIVGVAEIKDYELLFKGCGSPVETSAQPKRPKEVPLGYTDRAGRRDGVMAERLKEVTLGCEVQP